MRSAVGYGAGRIEAIDHNHLFLLNIPVLWLPAPIEVFLIHARRIYNCNFGRTKLPNSFDYIHDLYLFSLYENK